MESVKNFLQNEKAHTFNFVFASILFFGFGLPTVSTYGYSNNVYAQALEKQRMMAPCLAGALDKVYFQ